MEDKLKTNCGVFGIYNHPLAAKLTYYGLYALQHRGQESAGIVSTNGNNFYVHKGMGLVTEVFNDNILKSLPGKYAIGHVRYSTTGASKLQNAQPILATTAKGEIAIAHNGNIINAQKLRRQLSKEGVIFQTTTDSELILQLIALSHFENITDAIMDALSYVKGAYVLLILTQDKLIGVRDPLGLRPLWIGKDGDSYVLSSESCALDLINAGYVREVAPNEMVVLDKGKLYCYSLRNGGIQGELNFDTQTLRRGQCVFEHIYFARPDSIIFGKNVYQIRKKLGEKLYQEQPPPPHADLVLPIPDSGVSAALGYSHACGLPYELGLIRNHYVGRTFIKPYQPIREMGVQIKLNPIPDVIRGKVVVAIDDSIVRGTTCKRIISMIKTAGVKEVHLRICSPPIKYPCFYGIDMPTQNELLAATKKSTDEIAKFLRVDSLGYLSIDGLFSVIGDGDQFCAACFNGNYPITD